MTTEETKTSAQIFDIKMNEDPIEALRNLNKLEEMILMLTAKAVVHAREQGRSWTEVEKALNLDPGEAEDYFADAVKALSDGN